MVELLKKDLKILAVIPARGGSKGILRKNLALVGGRPLIAWSIAAAINSGVCHDVIVSTDDEEIADVAKAYGANVPFMRPASLAKDDSPIFEALNHVLDKYEDKDITHILQLNPTSPLRTENHIKEVYDQWDGNCESIVSVCKAHTHPYWCKKLDKQGRIKDFLDKGPDQFKIRQELPDVYALTGAIFLVSKDLVRANTYYSDKTYAYIMEASDALDIDEPWELYLANLILRDRKM